MLYYCSTHVACEAPRCHVLISYRLILQDIIWRATHGVDTILKTYKCPEVKLAHGCSFHLQCTVDFPLCFLSGRFKRSSRSTHSCNSNSYNLFGFLLTQLSQYSSFTTYRKVFPGAAVTQTDYLLCTAACSICFPNF